MEDILSNGKIRFNSSQSYSKIKLRMFTVTVEKYTYLIKKNLLDDSCKILLEATAVIISIGCQNNYLV